MSATTLQFLGAAGTVTGSRFLIKTDRTSLLVDAGLFQGLKELRLRNWNPFPVDPATLTAVALSHAHLDHCGYLPALVRDGFSGPIHCTQWTAELAAVILRDSAKLQFEDAQYAARKGFSKHAEPKPLYSIDDVEQTIQQFRVVEFRTPHAVSDDVQITFYPSGHVLGAAFLEVTANAKRLLFTGDMGRPEHPLLAPPDHIPDGNWDAIITESTYGDRSHEPPDDAFAAAINMTINRGGSVLIPAFAVDRTEVILMELRRLMDTQLIKRVPVYVDSPMAMRALELYRQAIETSSPEVQSAIAAAYSTSDPFNTGTLREVASVEESKKLNDPHQPCIIISASGMATGGRVVHHLRGMLPDPDNTVILVGFQAAGTRGRSLADGAKFLKMFGNYIPVRADVVQVGSFSVHADTDELLGWLERAEFDPKIVYVVHGEISAADEFAERICRDLNWCAVVPRDGEKVVL